MVLFRICGQISYQSHTFDEHPKSLQYVNHAFFLQPLLHILSETLKTILPRSHVTLLQLKTFSASLHVRSVSKTDFATLKTFPFGTCVFVGLSRDLNHITLKRGFLQGNNFFLNAYLRTYAIISSAHLHAADVFLASRDRCTDGHSQCVPAFHTV